MISTQSRSKDWIMGIRGTSRIPTDPILIEKMILALTLLENMSTSGLEFIFKGGTSMLLVLGAPMRFSIDLDIVTGNRSRIGRNSPVNSTTRCIPSLRRG